MLDRCSCLITGVCAQTMLAAYNAGHNHYVVLDGGNLSCDPSRPDLYGTHNYYYVIWGDADPGAAAAAAPSTGFGGAGWQWALWLPPFELQCRFWHRRPQYHTAPHPAQRWLTLSRPVTLQPALAQGKSAAAEAASFFPILQSRLPFELAILLPGLGAGRHARVRAPCNPPGSETTVRPRSSGTVV